MLQSAIAAHLSEAAPLSTSMVRASRPSSLAPGVSTFPEQMQAHLEIDPDLPGAISAAVLPGADAKTMSESVADQPDIPGLAVPATAVVAWRAAAPSHPTTGSAQQARGPLTDEAVPGHQSLSPVTVAVPPVAAGRGPSGAAPTGVLDPAEHASVVPPGTSHAMNARAKARAAGADPEVQTAVVHSAAVDSAAHGQMQPDGSAMPTAASIPILTSGPSSDKIAAAHPAIIAAPPEIPLGFAGYSSGPGSLLSSAITEAGPGSAAADVHGSAARWPASPATLRAPTGPLDPAVSSQSADLKSATAVDTNTAALLGLPNSRSTKGLARFAGPAANIPPGTKSPERLQTGRQSIGPLPSTAARDAAVQTDGGNPGANAQAEIAMPAIAGHANGVWGRVSGRVSASGMAPNPSAAAGLSNVDQPHAVQVQRDLIPANGIPGGPGEARPYNENPTPGGGPGSPVHLFSQLDSAGTEGRPVGALGTRTLEVGLPDSGVGAVAVQAHLGGGQVTASILVARESAMHQVVHELPAMQQFLAASDVAVKQVTVDLSNTGHAGGQAGQGLAGGSQEGHPSGRDAAGDTDREGFTVQRGGTGDADGSALLGPEETHGVRLLSVRA